MARKITRRDFLKVSSMAGTCVIGAPALLGISRGPGRAWASTKPIKIGGIYSLSGVVAAWGRAARMGASMAATEINDKGGILGRKVVLKFEDDSVNPEVGARKARRLVLDWRADFLHGFNSSGVALGVVPLLEKELNRICLIPCAASPRITTEAFNKYVFRVHPNCYQIGAGAAAIAAKKPYKRWTVIGPDYSYGWDSWGAFITHLTNRRPDVEVLKVQAWPKFATGDYTSYITKLLGAKPEGVYSSLWGGDFVTFCKQAKRYGFFDKVETFMTPAGLALDSFSALAIKRGKASEMPENLYTAAHGYWFEHPATYRNKQWVSAFLDRYGEPPHIVAHDAYGLIYTYKKAIEMAGTTKTDGVIEALEGIDFETPGYARKIRREDHQAISDVPWGYTAKAPELSGFLGAMRIKEIKDSVGREIIEPIDAVLERRARKGKPPWMQFVVKG